MKVASKLKQQSEATDLDSSIAPLRQSTSTVLPNNDLVFSVNYNSDKFDEPKSKPGTNRLEKPVTKVDKLGTED
jgi:hypothetical protein